MNKAFFEQLYDYTFWADRKFFDCVMTLTDEQYRQDIDFSQGSISNHVVHMMGVEHWWIHFLATGELDFFDEDVYELPRDAIREKWDQIERNVRAYLARLTPEELARPVKPEFWGAGDRPIAVWEALVQVVHHSADHRVQAMAMLHTQFGAPTFEQDFLSYLHGE
jgi:uncharacterized damage-inducible protein DinB